MEQADIVYFTGHGSPSGFYFRSDVPDDSQVQGDFTTSSAGNDGDLRLGHGDLEWLGLEVCNTLQMDAFQQGANRDVFDRWADAFEGLHALLSFTTTSLDLANPGRAFASALDGRWMTAMYGIPEWIIGRHPMRVIDAWFWMAQFTQPRLGGVGGPLRQQRGHQHRRGLPARPRFRQPRPAARRLLVLLDLDPARLLSARTLPEGTVMTTISVARVRPAALDDDRLRALAESFRIDGDVVRTEEAFALVGKEATLVHGGPGNRLAGVTTLVDTVRGVAAADPEKDHPEPLPAEKALGVTAELTERFGLGPTVARFDGVRLESSIDAAVVHAVRFDGKERTRFAVKTDVRSRVTLDGIPVTGPRAGVNATFLDDGRPLRLMATTWDAVELHHEAELVEEGEAAGACARGGAAPQGAPGHRPQGRLVGAGLLGRAVRGRCRPAGAQLVHRAGAPGRRVRERRPEAAGPGRRHPLSTRTACARRGAQAVRRRSHVAVAHGLGQRVAEPVGVEPLRCRPRCRAGSASPPRAGRRRPCRSPARR